MAALTFSVVVAGFRRRPLLTSLRALAAQAAAPPFQVIVVLDGPDDETTATIARHPFPFDVMLLEQSRRGLHHARDLGASAARGDVVLFVDETVLVYDKLLAELHLRHEDGAPVLQPGVRIDLGAPATVVVEFSRRWVARRRSRLDDGGMRPSDLCASPLSLTAATYGALRETVGVPGFSHPGVAEDFRLGHALNELGIRAEPLEGHGCSLAVGETLADLLALSHEIGAADAALAGGSAATEATIAAARADRWPTGGQAAAAVESAPARAAAGAARASARLLAEARRGMLAPNAVDRLERAVGVAYWLGHGGHEALPSQPG